MTKKFVLTCVKEKKRKEQLTQRTSNIILEPDSENTSKKSSENNSSPKGSSNSLPTSVLSTYASYKINLWPGGKVPYVFSQDFSGDQKVRMLFSMQHIEEATDGAIEFFNIGQSVPDQGGYIKIILGDSYEANLGYMSNQPTMLMIDEQDVDDKKGPVIHELLHTLGVRHEQNRPDRDNYVTVCWDNIDEEESHNFYKAEPSAYFTFGVPYNYYSVMHYSSDSFGINSYKPTIQIKDENACETLVGQRCFLTIEDVNLLKMKYKYEAPLSP